MKKVCQHFDFDEFWKIGTQILNLYYFIRQHFIRKNYKLKFKFKQNFTFKNIDTLMPNLW